MSLRSTFGTNQQVEQDGVWVEYTQNEDGSVPRFKIARTSKSNKRYAKALEVAMRPHKRAIQLETLSNKLAEELLLDVFVGNVLLDWEDVPLADVTGDDSDEGFAPFNKVNGKALLSKLPELYEDLQSKANSASLFKEEVLESEAKN